jgi:beta-glucosidase
MDNRTYRYFKGVPLYPFGYGLSYSKFKYSRLKLPTAVKSGQTLSLSVNVKNAGKKGGEEVVQVYLSWPDAKGKKPVRALKGFQRIFLKAGETKTVQFNLSPEELSIVDENGRMYQPKSSVVISIGGGQPGVTRYMTSNVVEGKFMVQ